VKSSTSCSSVLLFGCNCNGTKLCSPASFSLFTDRLFFNSIRVVYLLHAPNLKSQNSNFKFPRKAKTGGAWRMRRRQSLWVGTGYLSAIYNVYIYKEGVQRLFVLLTAQLTLRSGFVLVSVHLLQ
jgi:hypothetical protein